MEEWKEYKLGDLIKLSSGGTPDKKNDSYWGGAIPWISAKSMYDDYLYSSDLTITNEGLINGSRIAPVNSILLLTRGSGLFNRIPVCLVKKEMAFNQDVKCLESKNQDIVSNLFLFYWLMGNKHEISAILETTGIGAGKIDTERLKNIKINLPPVRTQKALVQFAESIMLKIEVNRRLNDNLALSFLLLTCFVLWLLKRINDNLQQQTQALYKSWFIDFEPFQNEEFIDSELGMIPKGWIVGDIYNYVDVIYGAPYKSSMFNDNKEGLPLIRIRDLKTNSPQFFTPEILPNTEYIEAGDIVAGMDAEFTPYLWLGEKGVLNQRCCKFKAKNNAISNYYILFLVKPELEYVQSYKTGTTVSHLGKSDIDRFKFIIPPLDVILAFSEKVNYMKEEVVNRARESRHLAQLRDTLLPRLMSGELKLSELTV